MTTILGYVDAALTRQGADGGWDVVAADAIAQVKHVIDPVGRPALQQLVGTLGGRYNREFVFYSSAGFTQPAIDFARWSRVALFEFDDAGDVRAMNDWATSLARSGAARRARASRLASRPPHWGVLSGLAFIFLHPFLLLILHVYGSNQPSPFEGTIGVVSVIGFCGWSCEVVRLSNAIRAAPDLPELNGPVHRLVWPRQPVG